MGEKKTEAKELDTVLSGQQTDTKVCNERDGKTVKHHYDQSHQKKSSIRYTKVKGFSITGGTGSFAGTTITWIFTYCNTLLPVLFFRT